MLVEAVCIEVSMYGARAAVGSVRKDIYPSNNEIRESVNEPYRLPPRGPRKKYLTHRVDFL